MIVIISASVFAVVFLALVIALSMIGLPSYLDDGVVLTMHNVSEQKTAGNFPDIITVMSYNIHYGYGYSNADKTEEEVYDYLDGLAKVIKDADIVALEEVDLSVPRSHGISEIEYLAKKGGFRYAYFSDNWNFKLLPFLDPVYFSKLRTGHAVLSKYPIKQAKTLIFEKPDASFWHRWFFIWRTQQVVNIGIRDKTLQVFNVHLESESRDDRMSQARQLVDMIRHSKRPLIVLGDFNALMPEASVKDFSGENYLGDDTISIIRKAGLRELFPPEQYLKDESRYFTFPSKRPDRRLDYFYYSSDIDISSAKVLGSDALKDASDHLPVLVRFRLKNS